MEDNVKSLIKFAWCFVPKIERCSHFQFPIIFGVSFFFFPDTPVFYLTKGQPEEARESLKFFRGRNCDVEPELCELAQAADRRMVDDGSVWRNFTTKQAIKSLTMSIGMMVFQQLSGVNSIIFYTTAIFQVGWKLSWESQLNCKLMLCFFFRMQEAH